MIHFLYHELEVGFGEYKLDNVMKNSQNSVEELEWIWKFLK